MIFEGKRDNRPLCSKKDHSCEPHFHHSIEMLYVLSGEKTVYLGEKTYRLMPRDLLLCTPYVMHSYLPSENGEQFAVTAPSVYCEAFEKACNGKTPMNAVYHDDAGELLPLFERLSNCDNNILHIGLINVILGIFLQNVPLVITQDKKEPTLVERIVNYIDESYSEDITLKKISSYFGYSPNYFSTMFKHHFHTSFPNYLNQVRIRKSITLLNTHNVSTVYSLCGFKNPQQYFLYFKKTYGYTPKQFLKNYKNEMQPLLL